MNDKHDFRAEHNRRPDGISEHLADRLVEALGDAPDLVDHTIQLRPSGTARCLYLKTLVDINRIEQELLRFFTEQELPLPEEERFWEQLRGRMPAAPVSEPADFGECVYGLLDGKCAIVLTDLNRALLIDVGLPEHRPINEPQTETTVKGPKEAFTECLQVNLSLVRKRIKSADLRLEELNIGSVTRTTVVVAYMRSLAQPEVVRQFHERLRAIDTDSVLDSAYIEEWIREKRPTPFPTMLSTERPDVVASHVLEGNVVVFVDGSPIVLIGPVTFFQFFSAPDDYYQRPGVSSLLRWLRIFSFMLAIFVPSLYIAVVSYHQALLPTTLLINIASQREGVPFPSYIEATLMLLTFEVLREAGLRMPRVAGQAISIVGALVLGQAAVDAGLVSPAMVIVVSITAIANFVSPNYNFSISQRLLQFAFMALAATMGLFGLLCGALFTIVHLASLKSFGVPYLTPVSPTVLADWKDTLIRVPRPWMKTYPQLNRKRKRIR